MKQLIHGFKTKMKLSLMAKSESYFRYIDFDLIHQHIVQHHLVLHTKVGLSEGTLHLYITSQLAAE